MAGQKVRAQVTTLGADGNGAWTDYVMSGLFGAINTVSPAALYVAPQVTPYQNGGTTIEQPPLGGALRTLAGVWIVTDANVAEHVATDVTINLLRNGAVFGGSRIAGWASGTNPALTAWIPTFVPFDVANTALLPIAPLPTVLSTTKALLPLQPFDVITASEGTIADITANFFFLLDIQ